MATEPRRYRTGLREEQVSVTRRRVLAAARELFLAHGYTGTTLDAIAARAEVSPQTIYNAVGGKAKVLKAIYDVALSGDDAPVAMNDRPEMQAMIAETDARRMVARYVAVSRGIYERVGNLLTMVLAQAATGDRDLRAFVDTVEEERATGNAYFVRHLAQQFGLRPGLTVNRATDLVWTLTAPEVVDRLVHRRGWSLDQYETFLSTTLATTLLSQPEH